MELQKFIDNIPTLSDLELAVLLALIAKQHCLVSTDDELIDSVASELALIVSETFKLTYVILEAKDLRSAEHFGEAILDPHHNFASESEFDDDSDAVAGLHSRIQGLSFRRGSRNAAEPDLDRRLVVNVVIAKDFNTAPDDIQTQTLELIRRNRIFSRTTVHPTPKTFLFLPLVSTTTKHIKLNHHLNDRIFMSHHHTVENGFTHLEMLDGIDGDEILRLKPGEDSLVVKQEMIELLRQLGKNATMTPEIRRYVQDIIVFMRLERGVDGGVSAYSNVCFVELAKYLAPLNGVDFVTPSIVGLAARKVFPHRLNIALPSRDRSLQYGSNIHAVKQQLEGLIPEDVIESVLEKDPVKRLTRSSPKQPDWEGFSMAVLKALNTPKRSRRNIQLLC